MSLSDPNFSKGVSSIWNDNQRNMRVRTYLAGSFCT